MELFKNASDDQVALAICFGGFVFSMAILYVSYHLGRLTNSTLKHDLDRQSELAFRRQNASSDSATEPVRRDRAA